MTEAEWLAATNPREMLNFLRGKASARKLGLYACASVRRVWHLLDDLRSREAVEAVENEAMQEADLHSIEAGARQTNGEHYARIHREPVGAGRWTARALQRAASAATAVLLGSPVYNNASWRTRRPRGQRGKPARQRDMRNALPEAMAAPEQRPNGPFKLLFSAT